ncbi:enoyl-CoA hydratase [Zoogloea sp.]|uniref:enoyl-CoA hydratase/isomerase family protein n=1 Tax=Zoogloea sp. TaxID=49181 RepID=UPI00261C7EDF|nr:enoyl-CoA hydratase [Zoogloea sp.]MDD3353816.1 enoyl-CoA hydratase [Zoogloea sp.]
MSDTPIVETREGGIHRIHFNRPKVLNAINVATAEALRDAARRLKDDPALRVVILSGEGRSFMAGGDISQFRDDPTSVPDTIITPLNEAMTIFAGLRAPVIASIQGPVAGAGMSMALACDLIVAADSTRFNFAYVNLGTCCDVGASWSLPRSVGLHKALEIALLSDPIDATEAQRLGLVNRVVPADHLRDETDKLAQRLAQGAPVAQGVLKQLMRRSFERDFASQLEAERQGFGTCAATADFQEAVNAFLEKRPATYQGR